MALVMIREKLSGLDGRTYDRFTEVDSTEARPFTITASASGVSIKGQMQVELSQPDDFVALARAIGDASKSYIALKKEALAKLNGGRS